MPITREQWDAHQAAQASRAAEAAPPPPPAPTPAEVAAHARYATLRTHPGLAALAVALGQRQDAAREAFERLGRRLLHGDYLTPAASAVATPNGTVVVPVSAAALREAWTREADVQRGREAAFAEALALLPPDEAPDA